jgi:methyl-accepting chemotaxis protein WspA
MKHWTFRTRILVSFAVMLILMVIMASVAYSRLIVIRQQVEEVQQDSLPGLYNAGALMTAWLNDYLITDELLREEEAGERRRLETALQSNRGLLDKVSSDYERTQFSDADRQAFETFKSVRSTYTRLQDELLTGAEFSRRAELTMRMHDELRPELKRGETAIQTLQSVNRNGANSSADRSLSSVWIAELSVFGSLAVALGLAVVCGFSLLRAISKVNNSVVDIAATAKQQQATANEIAGTTTEIGATSREISATSKELVKTMTGIASVADEAANVAGSGQTALTQMEATIRQVIDAGASVNSKLATLNERAGDISQVVSTITKVADQTNLLSLNAAIEAEKAGEYGRGFAVVATEIRRLADQTAVATLDIDKMVKAIQSSVAAGVMSMDKFSEEVRRSMDAVHDVSGTLSQVIQHVQTLAPRFEAVTEGVEAQATGAEQITEALVQLSEATRQTVESLRESTRAIDRLNEVAGGRHAGASRMVLQPA